MVLIGRIGSLFIQQEVYAVGKKCVTKQEVCAKQEVD